MTVELKGVTELLVNLKHVGAKIEGSELKAVFGTANAIRNSMIKSINDVSGGTTVTRYGQGGGAYSHTASKAGDAPNTDTGDLIKSIAIEPQRPAKTMYVGVNAAHAIHLEFRTRNMEARPFAQPAIDANKNTLRDILADELKQITGGI